MKKALLVCAAVLGGLLAAGVPARADLLLWTEHWTVAPHNLKASGPGKGGVTIATDPVSAPHLPGTLTVPVASLSSFSNDQSSTPQTFNDVPVTLTLKIHDLTDKKTGTLTFTGELNGTLNAKTSDLTLTWDAPSQNLHLGHYWYDVTLHSLNPGGVQPTGSVEKMYATINVHHNPEPSSLILAALGAPLFLLPGYRRYWRKRVAPPVA